MILHLFLVELRCLLDERLHNFLVFSINPSRLLLFDDIVEWAPHHRLTAVQSSTTSSHTYAECWVRSLHPRELPGVLKLQLRLCHVMNELFGLYFGRLHLRHYCVRGYGPLIPLRVVALRGLSMQVHIIIVGTGVKQRLRWGTLEGSSPVYWRLGCHVWRVLYAYFRAHV